MTPTKAKELVHRSGMILIPNWDIEKAFVLDQLRRQDKIISYEAIGSDGFKRGSRFNVDTKTLAVWSVAPNTKKPKMMDISVTAQGSMIVWTIDNTLGKELSSLVKHFALMNEAKVDQIEDRLASLCNECLDIRRLYEEELKSNYVHKQRIGQLKGKIQSLEVELASLKEKLKNTIEVGQIPRKMEEERHSIEEKV